MRKVLNFINGERKEPSSSEYFDILNPTNQMVIAQSARSNALDAVYAVQAASKAFSDWSQTPPFERAALLNKVADLIEKKADFFAQLECENVGKPLALSRSVDVERTILNFRYFAAKLISSTTESILSFSRNPDQLDKVIHYHNTVLRQPCGVAALIAPWNYPLYTLTWKLAPCLAMGNTAVCKPSELTPLTADALCDILTEAGIPRGVVNFVFGYGSEVGAPLVQNPVVKLISFTGSNETGAQIQKLTAGQHKKLSLEMGGKNATIVFNDANLKEALAGALRAAFINSGQVCLAGSRLFLQEGIYKEFLSEFVKATQELKVGNPKEIDTFMGPLASAAQLEKVEAAVAQARLEKGKILCGGERFLEGEFKKGFFYKPTVIEDLTMCSDLWQNEIFGPVVTVMSFKYPHEAVKWANTSSYGLSASVWTESSSRALQVASQIQAGTVWVNSWAYRDPRVPFGGVKASGLGREGGDFSLNFYSDIKTICTKA